MDQKEIKKVCRTLPKRYHPDSNQEDQQAVEHFHKITEVYGILSDEKKRVDYDARLKEADVRPEGKKAAKKSSGNNGYQKNGYQKNEEMKANPSDASDLFERYMGIRKQRGLDVNAREAIDLTIACVWGAVVWIVWRYVESGVIRNVLVGVSVIYVLDFSAGAYLDKDRRKLALSPGVSRLPVKTDHITGLAFSSEEDTELMVRDLYGKVPMVIGRDVKESRTDVDLSGGPYASMVDMEYAVSSHSSGNRYVEDLGSVNGLGIQKVEDGRLYRLSLDTPCKLEQGDVIYIGMNRLLTR